MENSVAAYYNEKMLTSKQTAEFLNVSEDWLQRQRTDKTGPAYVKCRHKIRYRHSDLLAWVQRHTILPDVQR
ncbi:MAG: helix-turn-helix domain-containing protein [Gammaproteobacteria bacterium]|nr:helix-turn-helix domain-containing protein [Gammaproteobacteria bacterium]